MRCAHPEEFVPQWPSDNASVNHARRKANAVRTPRGAASNPPLQRAGCRDSRPL